MFRALTGFFVLAFIGAPFCVAASSTNPFNPAARELKQLLDKEKASYAQREAQRRDVLVRLDNLNQNQNQVRKRLNQIAQSRQELNMAADNLSIEVQKQKESEAVSKQRLLLLLKVVYRVHRDGIVRFAMSGKDLGTMVKRARVLYRTLRANSGVAQQMQARSRRLAESEMRLTEARQSMVQLENELREQEGLLGTFLDQKKRVLRQLQVDQERYHALKDQYQVVQEEVKVLFEGIDKKAPVFIGSQTQNQSRTLLAPVEKGSISKRFGRTVHDKFRTVVVHKGLEIEAEHRSPVRAVAEGKVEFEGWIRGLGNVVVIQHAGADFSLSAHLFETNVKAGDAVTRGQLIGSVGDTGTNSRPGLYFELRHRGKAIDPLPMFELASAKTLTQPLTITSD